jgi:hypothetical protein
MPTLYVDPTSQQFYLVPDGVELEPGALTVITLPEGSQDVDPTSIGMWACGQEEARDFMMKRATEWGSVAQEWAAQGWTRARKRDWRGVLSAARVDRGLDFIGKRLRKAAEDLNAPPPKRPSTVLLCSVCYADVDDHDPECEACSSDLGKDAPVELTAVEFAALARERCAACEEEMFAAASVCLSCSTWQ